MAVQTVKTATIRTTIDRKTGQVIRRRRSKPNIQNNSEDFYRPLVEMLYKDFKEKCGVN